MKNPLTRFFRVIHQSFTVEVRTKFYESLYNYPIHSSDDIPGLEQNC